MFLINVSFLMDELFYVDVLQINKAEIAEQKNRVKKQQLFF